MVNRRQVHEVIVAASALAELILAVHTAAGRPEGEPGRRWRYGNVVGIGRPRLYDLALAAACTRHPVAGRAVAAVTIAAHRRVAVDVVFALSGADAVAQFHCATARPETPSEHEAAWADHLAGTTAAVLGTARVRTEYLIRCAGPSDSPSA
ncbi:hypothetical protein [Nocardia sp. alder85J]|uniref:hypothetical protein n=1 Tax=Nocardia sp. alder85J TaxID=2862949 RepID=UPI001CD30517|nr:hypothetical protein [Nocardia sp. alder85J]MCX4090926.1 hypothetical protein [Nocardia sp. alder85J]